ncbi:beta-1,3-galactosyltransferase 9 [Eucyclogobius newberryi]|uniref:beta-1,3-galactosyltransferase 9 n=1 Tax=Eucyclogobius newberryi TaxID=166745 RepID=UPI003B5C7741
MDVREKARKLDLADSRENVSQSYSVTNPDACTNNNLFILVLVFSSGPNVTQRDAIRETWAKQTQVQGFPVKILFFLGSTHTSHAQENVIKESKLYDDIVQGHVVSETSQWSQIEKTVDALRWVVTFCPVARFVLMTQDRVYVNLQAIGFYLLGLHRHPEDFYLGRVIQKGSPDRDPNSPGFLPPALYPNKFLPEYCDQTAYVLSQDMVRKVYIASAEVHAAVPADVFVGLCAQKAGVAPTHSARFSGEKHIQYNACCYRYLFSSAGMDSKELERVWKDMGQKNCSLFKTYSGLVMCKALTYLHKLSSSWD